MYTGDNIPGNVNTNEIDLNNGGLVLIAILIGIILVLITITIIMHIRNEKKIQTLKEFYKTKISEEELNLLIKYRKLDYNDKAVIKDTLKTLTSNHTNKTNS